MSTDLASLPILVLSALIPKLLGAKIVLDLQKVGHVTRAVAFAGRTFRVRGKGFAWERPFSKADLKRFGADPVPDGPIVALGAFLIALLIGLPLGRLAGRYRDTPADAGIRIFGVFTYAAPIFWTGIMFILLVVKLFPGWPTNDIGSVVTKFTVKPKTHILLLDTALSGDGGAFVDVLKHHVLPCLVLGLLLSGVIIRLVRINVIQAMKGDYVEAARARGIPERQVVRSHAFRNALVPVITVIGLQVAITLSGALVTERTFNWPGLGTELVQYVIARDYVAVQGLVTFFALTVVVVSVFVDILNALVDPRVRY